MIWNFFSRCEIPDTIPSDDIQKQHETINEQDTDSESNKERHIRIVDL
jgi:hypothetical protein